MANTFFTKAVGRLAYLKLALYGKTGSGKTLTSLLIAEGLAKREGKRVACIDTENGMNWYARDIPERAVHPAAFDFDRCITRSITETVEAIESIDPKEHCVIVLDSMTHLWEAAKAAFNGKLMSNGQIPVYAWSGIKKPYKRLMTLFLDGNFHAIICGREGVVMEDNEEGEAKVVGTKMKAEGETAYEPDFLGRMVPEWDPDKSQVARVFFEKDRSGILMGRYFRNPNYATVEPLVRYMSGGEQTKLGSEEATAERDIAAKDAQEAATARERIEVFEQIRLALSNAQTPEQLVAAWGFTKGKKTKLGDLFDELEKLKNERKVALVAVA